MVKESNISKTPVEKTKSTNVIEWNDNDLKAYTDIGITPPNHICMFEQRFLSRVDASREPTKRTVTAMVRLRAPDYSTPTRERKEYVYYRERWEGVDFRGIPINPCDHTMGMYTKQFTRPVINNQTGAIDYNVLDPGRAQLTYYIPYSKKTVEDIIAKSAPVNKLDIVYTVKFATEDFTFAVLPPSRCQFPYPMFANWKFEEICKYHVRPIAQAAEEFRNSNKSSYNMAFEPT